MLRTMYCLVMVALVVNRLDLAISSEGINNSEQKLNPPDEVIFINLFKQRRTEQIQAVKNLLNLENYEKQYKMVNIIVDKLFNVIQNSRVVLESSGYIPGFSMFPKNETLLDALANILENTALFGDVLLRLPEISSKILNSNNEWKVMYEWSLNFANQSRLLDNSTQTLIELVNMELNLTERHPDYVNPYYKRKISKKAGDTEPQAKKKVKKKKEQKRGPRMYTEL